MFSIQQQIKRCLTRNLLVLDFRFVDHWLWGESRSLWPSSSCVKLRLLISPRNLTHFVILFCLFSVLVDQRWQPCNVHPRLKNCTNPAAVIRESKGKDRPYDSDIWPSGWGEKCDLWGKMRPLERFSNGCKELATKEHSLLPKLYYIELRPHFEH